MRFVIGLDAYYGETRRAQCPQMRHPECFKAASHGSSLDGETRTLTAIRVDTHNDCKAALAVAQSLR